MAGVRTVAAPAGITWIEPAEMTASCGAGTAVAELDDALREYGQCVAIPSSGSVGGALAVGRSGLRRLGYGPVRDALLQARYVSAAGELVKAGGPTVKNVSGFDLCRLLVGSRGTLGFIGDVILRTRPRARFEQWFRGDGRPGRGVGAAVPADGRAVGRLVGVGAAGRRPWRRRPADRAVGADGRRRATGAAGRRAVGRSRPAHYRTLRGRFVVELGVGVVHHEDPPPRRDVDPVLRDLHHHIKERFDPTGRLNPGVDVLDG